MRSSVFSSESYPPPGAAWSAAAVLLVAYVSSMIDRVVISFLVRPIKTTFHAADWQVSLLSGIAFTAFYTALGIPAGTLADSRSRRLVVAWGVALWSAATVACAFARSYGELFVARAFVGVGEATLGPAAYSLLADYFPPERRATAFSVYSMGITAGTGAAVVLAGAFAGLAAEQTSATLPFAGAIPSWQLVFVAAGAPGFLIALWALALREPPRRNAAAAAPSLGETLKILRPHWKTLALYCAGFGCFSIFNQGVGFWLPEFFARNFGWQKTLIGQAQGIATALCGTAGLAAGGAFTRRLRARGRADAPLGTMTASAAGLLLCALPLPFMPTGWAAAALLAPIMFFGFAPYGAATAGLQDFVPNRLRGRVGALFLFTINVLGGGAGPILVAALADFVFDGALRYAIFTASASGLATSLVLYGLGMKRFRQSVELAALSEQP